MFTHQIHQQNCRDSRQILKEIGLFKPHVCEADKVDEKLVIDWNQILFTWRQWSGFPCQQLCTNSSSLHLCTENLVTHAPWGDES